MAADPPAGGHGLLARRRRRRRRPARGLPPSPTSPPAAKKTSSGAAKITSGASCRNSRSTGRTPALAGEEFELATSFKDRALGEQFRGSGWRIVSPDEISVDYRRYVDYIRASKGEFTVAKDQYVRLNTGWFSDRSACYLAAGRPVITQQTGFTRFYGGKRGLLAFETAPEIVEAVQRINKDYVAHSKAARELAREFFEAEDVLRSMLERAGI